MKVDLYTKVVLTVIAVCLSLLTLDRVDLLPRARAAAVLPESAIRSCADAPLDVRLVGIRLSEDSVRAVPVTVENRLWVSNGFIVPLETQK